MSSDSLAWLVWGALWALGAPDSDWEAAIYASSCCAALPWSCELSFSAAVISRAATPLQCVTAALREAEVNGIVTRFQGALQCSKHVGHARTADQAVWRNAVGRWFPAASGIYLIASLAVEQYGDKGAGGSQGVRLHARKPQVAHAARGGLRAHDGMATG